MITYRNIYDSDEDPIGGKWLSPKLCASARCHDTVDENNSGCGPFVRVEMLAGGVPFRPPVGFTKREPTFVFRRTDGDFFLASGAGTTHRIFLAHEYTLAEISQQRVHTPFWGRYAEQIPTDEAYERYAGGL